MTVLDPPIERAVPTTGADILAAARTAGLTLRTRAAEIERRRELPADVVELIRGTGVLRAGFGAEFGGPALTASEQTAVLEELSYGDASAGWCAMVGMDGGLFANYLAPGAVREMFPSLDLSTAGMLAAGGRADRVPGGYRVSGRWGFGSGIRHADWVFAGVHTTTDGTLDTSASGTPVWRIMMVRPSDVVVADNWHATGLAGSGSADFEIDGAFVPAEHTFSFDAPRTTHGPCSTPDLQMRKMPGVPLGVARAALDHVRALARTPHDGSTGDRLADDHRAQRVIGECTADLVAARHAVHASLDHRWARLSGGTTQTDLTAEERVDTALTRVGAFRAARGIVRRLYDLLASTSIDRASPMDRWLRDTETMCQHFMAQDQIVQSAGAFLLGGAPRNPLVLGILDRGQQR